MTATRRDSAGGASLAAALGVWLPRQRWFAGKARAITQVDLVDELVLSDRLVDHLVTVTYADGGRERYQIPLVAVDDGGDAHLRTEGHPPLRDAVHDPASARLLAGLTSRDDVLVTRKGDRVIPEPVGAAAPVPDEMPVRLVAGEQSNSSLVLGDTEIVKLFRRLETGVNPDLELTRALTEAGFAHVPAQLGAVELVQADGSRCALGVRSVFLAGARDGWALACTDAEATGAGAAPGMAAASRDLGAVVAECHVALAAAFGTQPAGVAETTAWADAWRHRALAVLDLAAVHARPLAAPVIERTNEVLEALGALARIDDPGPLVRVHGDLHLGQTLRAPDGTWYLLDFEGEPARPLADRRAPGPPARDVAGMLRSFDYAAAQAARTDSGTDPKRLDWWREELRSSFLEGYLGRAADAGLLPAGQSTQTALLRAFELDKAVYELGYELANRPDWVAIPIGGILRLLDARDGQTTTMTGEQS
jgi:maltokinase